MNPREFEFDPVYIREQTRPPSLFGRYLLLILILLICTAFAMLFVFSLDIVVKTRGIVVADVQNQKVNAGIDGVIASVLAKQGQRVQQGDTLLTIHNSELIKNQQQTAFEASETASKLRDISAVETQLNALKTASESSSETPSDTLMPVTLKSGTLNSGSPDSAIIASLHALKAKLRELAQNQEINQSLKQEALKKAQYLQRDATLATDMVAIYQESVQQGLTSKVLLLEHQQNANRIAAERASTQDDIAVIEQQMSLNLLTKSKLIQEFELQLATEKQSLTLAQHQLTKELAHLRNLSQTSEVRATINGVIHEMSEINQGMSLHTGQHLLTIVPDNHQLEVDAWIKSQDIGFIEPGQPAVIKVDAYSFGKYGAVSGVLSYVSKDIFARSNTDNPLPSDYAFKAKILIDKNGFANPNLTIIPGMTVSAELVTGKRKAYEFLYRPAHMLFNNSFKER